MGLETYNQKRDFSRTPEPAGDIKPRKDKKPKAPPSGEQLRFVVQEHHASHQHYDFRLEMDGVLKSWAVPKGPPADYAARRLAIQTEDHPIKYLTFSGTIAPGNYGAGEMSIWDSGWYENVSPGDPDDGVANGKLELILHGTRLAGKYDLILTKPEKQEWIFIKSRGVRGAAHKFGAPGAVKASMPVPGNVSPMLCTTLEEPFSDPAWQFEIKWDGYRALLFAGGGSSQLVSRNQQPLDPSFPELARLDAWLACVKAVVDGEIVALTADGKPSFQTLQNRYRRGHPKLPGTKSDGDEADPGTGNTIVYMAFDILHCDGIDVTRVPLAQRRELLASLIRPGGTLRFSDHVTGEGTALFEKLQAAGMEGIVAKRASSVYTQARSGDWAKIKTHRTADVVIGGYTESPSAARPFGALIIGEFDGGKLKPVGNVGTGFNHALMTSIFREMQPLTTDKSPFAAKPAVNGTPHWIQPNLVCEVKFSEITDDCQLRHPVFVALRVDKSPLECTLTSSAPVPAAPKPPKRLANPPEINAAENPERNTPKGATAKAKALMVELPPVVAQALVPGADAKEAIVIIDGHKVKLSNLAKQFWPATGTTKRDLLRYYASVSGALLPHLADRPLVVQRYPNGIDCPSFFQHDIGRSVPDYIKTFDIEEHGEIVHYALCNDLAALLHVINSGAVPLHTWNVRSAAAQAPDRIVFDLDPGTDPAAMIEVAHAVRSILDGIGLASYPKTSGASGLHIYVPIQPIYTSEQVVNFARLVGSLAEHQVPKLVTTQRRIKNRGEAQVYLDCLQNGVGKTVVAPYSVRAQPVPSVSTPLTWDEVTEALRPETFTIDTVLDRLRSKGELFAPVLERLQELGPALNAFAGGSATHGIKKIGKEGKLEL